MYPSKMKEKLEFPLWHNGIGSISGALGHGFDPWSRTVGERSGVATAAAQVAPAPQI